MSSCRNPSPRRRAPALLLVSSAVILSGCAHSNPPASPLPAQEPAAMTAPATPTDNPTLTAEEIGRRFLKLIEGLESRSDLSLERIAEVTGVKLSLVEGGGRYAHSEALGDGWYYSLWHVPASPSLKRGVALNFVKAEEPFANMASVCALDFDYYHAALKAMGYRDTPIHGEIGQLQSWRYYKNDITISIIPQNVVAGESGRLCVKSIGTLN
jgi:hypothetical protein